MSISVKPERLLPPRGISRDERWVKQASGLSGLRSQGHRKGPNLEMMFQQAFPGASFQAYLEANRRNSAVHAQEVFRVSSAFWR